MRVRVGNFRRQHMKTEVNAQEEIKNREDLKKPYSKPGLIELGTIKAQTGSLEPTLPAQ